MTDNACWQIIERARSQSGGEFEVQVDLITEHLAARPAGEILAFGSWVRRRMADAILPDLLLVVEWVYDVNGLGPVSGDGWEYWLGWLVARGRDDFDAARRDADMVADFFTDIEDFLKGEELASAAGRAYEEVTGEAEWPDALYEPMLVEKRPGGPAAAEMTPERLRARFPRMSRKFGMPAFAT